MDDFLPQPALFVGDIDDKIDLSLPPTSGEDYIKRVVIEAKKCESVVVADIDESIRLKNPTVSVKTLSGCVEAPISVKPSLEWQQCQVSDFSDLRLRVTGLRSQFQYHVRKLKQYPLILPDIEDQEGWIDFCVSKTEENSLNEPTLGIMFSMTHSMVEQVLDYLVMYIVKERKIRLDVGRWIYALLTLLKLPLNPDVCSCLRWLARICSTVRAETDPADEHSVNMLNLFICLVARYFRQLDFADA